MTQRSELGLTGDQVNFYKENGYVHVKNVLDSWELKRLHEESLQLIEHIKKTKPTNDDFRYAIDPVTGHSILHRVVGLRNKGRAFLDLYGHPRLLHMAEAILGPNFMNAGDVMVVKMPEYGRPTPWHRDPAHPHIRPPFDIDVYIDSSTPENGCLYAIPGSHLWAGFDLQEMVDRHGFSLPGAIPLPAEPGDVVLHSPNLLHGSLTTRGSGLRRIIYLCFWGIDEILHRGGQLATNHVQSWLRILLTAIESRATLTDTVDEIPYSYNPTMPEFHIDQSEPKDAEMEVPDLTDSDYDPAFRYSPLVTVEPTN